MAQTTKGKARLQGAGFSPLTRKRMRKIVLAQIGDANLALIKEILKAKRINNAMGGSNAGQEG